MKNLKKLFFVMLGAVAVLAFVSCSSPSSGGGRAYEYKVTINASTGEPDSTIDGTYYLKKPSLFPDYSEYCFYSDPECTTPASDPSWAPAGVFLFYGKKNGNTLEIGYLEDSNKFYVVCNLETKKFTDPSSSRLIVDQNKLKIDDVEYTYNPN